MHTSIQHIHRVHKKAKLLFMLFCDGRSPSAVSRLPVRKSLNDVKFNEANVDFSLVGLDIMCSITTQNAP